MALGWDLGDEGLIKQAALENTYSGVHETPLLHESSSKELVLAQEEQPAEDYPSEEHK